MKIALLIIAAAIVFTAILFITQYLPSKSQWDNCQEQMSKSIEQNNAELQKNKSDVKVQCEAHKKTYDESKACFGNVAEYNFLTRALLKNYKIKSMDKFKDAQQRYCSQYPETLVN